VLHNRFATAEKQLKREERNLQAEQLRVEKLATRLDKDSAQLRSHRGGPIEGVRRGGPIEGVR
jgi:hypothetical protein